jgi:hypothetical protein
LAELLQMSPQFLSSMFGEFSYMAPGDFSLHDEHECKQSLGKSSSLRRGWCERDWVRETPSGFRKRKVYRKGESFDFPKHPAL